MYRWGNVEEHNYVLGIFDTLIHAINEEKIEKPNRGGKYDGEIVKTELNSVKKREYIKELRHI